ncbi:MAG: arsenical efflux pump membrane protein ArsB [Firmicutes bacterium]|nr:arsenical efflux pump membrane protein ArsB [Alicyclobacillaceae bacterium]MCL6496061.1 arsenical efflux pump membrane protein ArsB [Bacillota bacterium]
MAGIEALGLFVAVLGLVLWQPRRIGIGWTAGLGGAAAVALGLVTWREVGEVVQLVWDATATLVALLILSAILDEAGLFAWAALTMARLSGGRGWAVFWGVGVLTALAAMAFANDGAALIVTPLVLQQARALGLSRSAALALAVTCGFVADVTSVPLVVSNLVNIISADFFHLGFLAYAAVMVPVDLVAFAAAMFLLWAYYRRDLQWVAAVSSLPSPRSAVRDPVLVRAGGVVLACLLAGYTASQWLHWPVSIFAASAAVAMAAWARRSSAVSLRQVVREAPWRIVVFSIGMYVVVFALRDAGLIAGLARGFGALAAEGPWAAVVGTGGVTAGLAAVMNNLPAVMVGALAIHASGAPPGMQEAMAYANVVGTDVGTKWTPIGSLATLLWMHLVERRGLRVRWGELVRVGLILTPPVLAVTLLALAGWWTLLQPTLGAK